MVRVEGILSLSLSLSLSLPRSRSLSLCLSLSLSLCLSFSLWRDGHDLCSKDIICELIKSNKFPADCLFLYLIRTSSCTGVEEVFPRQIRVVPSRRPGGIRLHLPQRAFRPHGA